MRTYGPWVARAWLPYLLAGVLWVTYGSVLGDPQGLGLIFIGLCCLSFGACGARLRLLHQRQHRDEPPHR